MVEDRTAKLETLFRLQQQPLCRYVYQIVGSRDDAIEVVQECFLRLWRSGYPLEGPALELSYLYKLARNLAIDFLRRNQVRTRYAGRPDVTRNVLVLPVTPEDEIIDRERDGLARAALARLGPKQRELLTLRASGFSYDEIADIAGVCRGSVGQTITRSLRKCRMVYEELTERRAEGARHASARR